MVEYFYKEVIKMARYKKQDTTSLSNMLFPPTTRSSKIEDMRTHRIGEGVGFTKEEAEDNAWKDLKYGKEPKYSDALRDHPVSSSGAGGGGGAPVSIGEFPGANWLVGIIIFLPFAFLIYFWGSVLLCFGLLAMCFGMIFTRPLRGIFGFGIPALCILALYLEWLEMGRPDGVGEITPMFIATAILVWLAPLMALARKPLNVFLAFVLFGALVGFFGWLAYFLNHHPEFCQHLDAQDPGTRMVIALGGIFGTILLMIIGLVIPGCLMIGAFLNSDDV